MELRAKEERQHRTNEQICHGEGDEENDMVISKREEGSGTVILRKYISATI